MLVGNLTNDAGHSNLMYVSLYKLVTTCVDSGSQPGRSYSYDSQYLAGICMMLI